MNSNGYEVGWHMDVEPAFAETYRCQPMSALPGGDRQNLEYGGKIVMPPSALDRLSRLNIMYPMLFRACNETVGKFTHCGVQEFVAREGIVYLPGWMMRTLTLNAGDLVKIVNTALPMGAYIKIQPQSTNFLDITDPRAVLEMTLRQFTTLTAGDQIALSYNAKVYELLVLETKPDEGSGGIAVVETDLQVEFAAPVGYEEPQHGPGSRRGEKSIASSLENSAPASSAGSSISFVPFGGAGRTLSGRAAGNSTSNILASAPTSWALSATPGPNNPLASPKASPPALNLPAGTLFFGNAPADSQSNEAASLPRDGANETLKDKWSAFSGQGNSLK